MNILDIANNLPGGNNQQNSQFAPSPNDTPRIRALKEKLAKREALRKENSRVTDAQKAIQQQGRQDILRTPQVQSAEDYASTTLGNTEEAQALDIGAQVMGTASSAVAGRCARRASASRSCSRAGVSSRVCRARRPGGRRQYRR